MKDIVSVPDSGNGRKILFYDVSGRSDDIYLQHFVSDGFSQDWLHFHSKYELTLVLEGRVEILSGDRRYVTDKPHLRLHRPYSFHTANAERGHRYECFVFYFTERSVAGAGSRDELHKLFERSFSLYELEGDDLECARRLAGINLLDIDDNMRLVSLVGLLKIVGNVCTATAPDGQAPEKRDYVFDVTKYIEDHFAEKLTSDIIAKEFFVSRQKLNLDFKRRMGETIHQYHMAVRVSRAAEMIAKGMSPLSASIECGFSDLAHFSKMFSAFIGMSPRRFAKTVRGRIEFSDDIDEKDTKPDIPPGI